MSSAARITGSQSAGFSVNLLLILAGIVAIVVQTVMLARIHPPNFDEVYFASASLSLANGGPAEAWIQTPWRVSSVAEFYGPVWFWLEAFFIRWFGVSVYVGRGLSLAGLLALAVAAAAAIRAAGASRQWAAAGFALAVWAPSLPVIDGRMDTTAQAFGLAGLAAFIVAIRRHDASGARLFAATAGITFGLSVLTSPRGGLLSVAMALSSPILTFFGFDRRRVGGAIALTTIAATVTATLGLALAGTSWIDWVAAITQGTVGTLDASPLLGGVWDLRQASRMAPAPVLFAVLAGVALWRRNGSPQARGMVAFVTAFAGLSTLLTVLLFGDPFGRTVQFVYCWLIAALIAAGTLLADRRRQVVMTLAVLALGCVGLRVNRYLEVAQSWAARDSRPVERFLRTHVPPAAIVYTESPYYFALHSVGLRPRAYIWVRLPWYATGTIDPFTPAAPRFLLLPDPDPELNNPPGVKAECLAAATLVAVFEPAPLPVTSILSRMPVYFRPGAPRGYSRTLLYRLPDGCDLG